MGIDKAMATLMLVNIWERLTGVIFTELTEDCGWSTFVITRPRTLYLYILRPQQDKAKIKDFLTNCFHSIKGVKNIQIIHRQKKIRQILPLLLGALDKHIKFF